MVISIWMPGILSVVLEFFKEAFYVFVHLTWRQACAIESAALRNPNWDIFVLSASPVGLPRNQQDIPLLIKALLSYPNVYFRNIDLMSYSRGTPAENLFSSHTIFTSQYLTHHLSDLLRLVTLFKFGGTYLDLDFIVQKSLEKLPPNFVAAESTTLLANAIMNFQHIGVGHSIVARYLE